MVLLDQKSKVIDFFENGEDDIYNIRTVSALDGREINDNFILTDLYLDKDLHYQLI